MTIKWWFQSHLKSSCSPRQEPSEKRWTHYETVCLSVAKCLIELKWHLASLYIVFIYSLNTTVVRISTRCMCVAAWRGATWECDSSCNFYLTLLVESSSSVFERVTFIYMTHESLSPTKHRTHAHLVPWRDLSSCWMIAGIGSSNLQSLIPIQTRWQLPWNPLKTNVYTVFMDGWTFPSWMQINNVFVWQLLLQKLFSSFL